MRALALALLVTSCASTRWTVEGGSPADQAQALALVDAARAVLPGNRVLEGAGQIHLRPSLTGICFAHPGAIPTGCIGRGVWVLWPTPFDCADLTCSALPHELCHGALDPGTEEQADACGLLVVHEYRRK